jgi:hypothetical protein
MERPEMMLAATSGDRHRIFCMYAVHLPQSRIDLLQTGIVSSACMPFTSLKAESRLAADVVDEF